ncbi:MAG: hypothetical protein JSS12_05475, partial [Verrucomicrobia bacterium]|nr:hypothetical protein [Verrucomicrobiota bacterium]
FRLIEWIEYLAIRVDNRMREGELAAFWGNRLILAARHEPDRLHAFFQDLTDEKIPFSGHFVQELLDHLFDEEAILPLVRQWAEELYGIPLADLLHDAHIDETSEQVVFSNCIKSLITLSQLSWLEIFEVTSLVHATLKEDPDGIYSQMDFKTRNSYRDVIEKMARRIERPEVDVAKLAIALAKGSSEPYTRHVGYYLVDKGRSLLEEKIGYSPTWVQTLRRAMERHATALYLGSIVLLTAALLYLAYPNLPSVWFLLLLLLPLSEISVQVVNFLVTLVIPTRLRPQMSFEKGIPDSCKTLIVIPTLLNSEDSIKNELDRLEIRYLANVDPALRFAIFSDFIDAPEEVMPEDKALLDYAINGIQALEKKYGSGKFFLFHRKRLWSPCEKCWMGAERKRGKLDELNRYLLGSSDSILYAGNEDALQGMTYVITLDADTQLPKDQARAMIEVLAHPLNHPYINDAKNGLIRGYTLIQPRVITDFVHSKASWFSQIFSDPAYIDPYTKAISNVYQDLFKEGTYHGKGIYHIKTFQDILSNRFPDNHILSHDLIEGVFVGVGFASNICLFDIFPKDFLTAEKRQHRWIRGDWQIIDWLLPKVPLQNGQKVHNPLSLINRWKILDNLRRAMMPVGLILLLIYAWTVPTLAASCTALALFVLLLPFIQLCISKLFTYSFSAIKSSLIDMKVLILRSIITISLMPFQAYNAVDAAIRVAYRRIISRTHLLQWTACEEKGSHHTDQHKRFLWQLGLVPLITIGVLAILSIVDLHGVPYALPICILWLLAPFIVSVIDKPRDRYAEDVLTQEDIAHLHKVAEKTWHYFDKLVGPETHWMPPDNYQTALNVEVAARTSPTNTGFWLLSLLSAYDFGFISCDTLIDKAALTLQELDKLERYQGHFLNWYNIQTLDPLYPRYVSTVDSGNLLASLWLLRQGLLDMIQEPIVSQDENVRARYYSWQSAYPDLTWTPSLEELARGEFPKGVDSEPFATAQWLAGEKLGLVSQIIDTIDRYTNEMDMKFLYSSDRKLFSIGYNVDDRRLDSSFYDLLASEARIASLVAIAKEDVPLEHWWALGRLYSIVDGRKVLLSWGGTMFEYLMPLIFNKHYKDSLLGEACTAAVACQIGYGRKRGIPWGISESAFSAIDAHKIYQYKSFGVPGLGLKRGLEKDLVISPYSSALSLAVDPKAAMSNLFALTSMMGEFGYFESIDYTRQRSPEGERGIIAYTYMAHHQGMILTSINNALHKDVLIERFHKDPRISGLNSLLYERIPSSTPVKIQGVRNEPVHRRLQPFSVSPIMGVVNTPESVTPKVMLLSNENYSLMITNSGGGYGRWGDIDVYRWRADTTCDSWGSFCYIKNCTKHSIWSAGYQPTKNLGKSYSVNFKTDKAEIKRRDGDIETILEIVVSPEDNAEVRMMTLINHSDEMQEIELTSYLELVLAPHLADRAHPAFNKLFIETEALPDSRALVAFRRMRSTEDRPIFAVHVVAAPVDSIEYETDRSRFIGRGNTLVSPEAMQKPLSNSVGTVLDPIFSIRCKVKIEAGKRAVISYVTAVTDAKDKALALIEKYKDIGASLRAIELAWTYAELELRYLRIQQEEVQLFQKLASRLIYPQQQLRTISDRMRKNKLSQSGLWPQGISGDWPIVVVTVGDAYDVDVVRQLLIAHSFLTQRGLKFDLVILNEEEMGYFQPLHEQLQSLILAYSFRNQPDQPGGVFLRNAALIPAEEFNLILAVASAVFIASRGSLRQQLVSPKARWTLPRKLVAKKDVTDEPTQELPFMELPYFNGFGGYSEDGKSYVIYLGPDTNTPAPWINVLANPQFGTLVTESGIGCTWFGNSQTNRLTPWSNDPVLNPISDVIYLRDEELGIFWTPTASPIREKDAYRVSHSQGYSRFEHNSHGIEQELIVFVPIGENISIRTLKLTNRSSRKRKISATSYSELVLGGDREETQMHLITEWDREHQMLLAFNNYSSDFGKGVVYSYSTLPVTSYTGDRAEFIGRNSSLANPAALSRKSLSGHTGAALDPCVGLQVQLEIDPGQTVEVTFVLGYAESRADAVKKSTDGLYSETVAWWDKTLETVTIDGPDKATNFLFNRWLVYQSLACRFWGRTGFYQSSGAYGFRDQLQDTMAIVYSQPQIAREYILKAASRQYVEGDVQHWWHPQTGAGVRTRCSDDLLWLPFVVAHYVRITQDRSILDEQVPFLQGELLKEGQDELFQVPTMSEEAATLLEHCRRAITKGITAGPHGLPLIGSCDWNDGMNRVGIHGKGESVWLAWFIIHVVKDFAELTGTDATQEADRIAEIVEENGWDGSWYRRAYFDDGTPIGSKKSKEASIDSLAQSWAVISRHGDQKRAVKALESAYEHLVTDNIVLLLTPPFDKTPHDPGYIKGYPPGVRENGGQYTHGSSWLAMAYARLGNGNRARDLLHIMSPTSHTTNPEECARYRVEPYVIAADIYSLANQVGRGGWTWYTGSSAWIWRIWLEEILGFTLRGANLSMNCALPDDWKGASVHYRFKSTLYIITINNPRGRAEVALVDDGKEHNIQIN